MTSATHLARVDPAYQCLKRFGWLIGGLLYGLSFPSHPFAWLGFLAPVALVPTLLSVIEEESFGRFFAKTIASLFIGCSVAIWWVYPTHYLASVSGGIALAICLSLPVLLLFKIRKFAGITFALLLFPFIWSAWEWLFAFLPFCIPLLFYGHTQSVHPWLIQYASVTGVWGVSFWLVACNALAVAAAYGILIHPGTIKPGHLRILLLLLALPPVYSVIVYQRNDAFSTGPGINILLVQPNRISQGPTLSNVGDLGMLVALTSKGISAKPDLIVWPEAAAQHPQFQLADMRDFVSNEVRDWDVPLLTGTLAVEYTADGPSSNSKKNPAYFNAAMMITPELASSIGQHRQSEPKMYLKRKLFPFVEFTPYADTLPFLTWLQLPLTAYRHTFTLGNRPETFMFKSRAGARISMGTLICFEEFYPNLAAELAQNGAQFIAIIGDEWQFGPEVSHYFNAMVSGVRAIETGLPMVRNANNGYLAVTDSQGVTTRIPAQGANATVANIPAILSGHPASAATFYVQHQNWFPVSCLLVCAILSSATALRKRRNAVPMSAASITP